MLTQKNRFHGHGSLKFLFKNGRIARSPYISIKYTNNPRRKNSRFAVIIGKKVIKSAVRRNRLRRRIYEILRLELPTLRDNYDVAVMVFSGETFGLTHQDLAKLIKQQLSQAGLYK